MVEMELMLAALLFAHFYLDFAGQGDFLAKAKNHTAPLPGVPWDTALFAHSVQHGAAVALITGYPLLGVCEAVVHGVTDYAKCAGWIDFNQDQAVHIWSKFAWFNVMAVNL